MRFNLTPDRFAGAFGLIGVGAFAVAPLWLAPVLGWGFIFVGIGVLISGAEFQNGRLKTQPLDTLGIRLKQMWPQILMLLGVIAFLAGAGAYWRQKGSAPFAPSSIAWDFNSHKPEVYFLSLSKASGGPTTLNDFQASADNTTDKPIRITKMYIRSDTTNAVLPVLFYLGTPELVEPKDTLGIPPRAHFTVMSERINTLYTGQPIQVPVEVFLKDFPSFTFVVEYDGSHYERSFSAEDVRTQIANFEMKALRENTRDAVPRVTRVAPPLPASGPTNNTMGNVTDNHGVITQGQTGDNSK